MSDCDKGDGTLAFNARLTFFAFDVYQIRLQAKNAIRHPFSSIIQSIPKYLIAIKATEYSLQYKIFPLISFREKDNLLTGDDKHGKRQSMEKVRKVRFGCGLS